MPRPIQHLMNWIKNINKKVFYLIGFGLIYFIWNYSSFLYAWPTNHTSLDRSWEIGLNWASQLHLRWLGDNMIFTYGPLYYLGAPLGPFISEFHPQPTVILTVIGLNLFYAICFTYTYSLIVNLHFKEKRKWIIVIVGIILLSQKPNIDLIALFAAFIFLPIVFSDDKTKKAGIERYIRYSIIALLLAIIPFVKFSYFYESFLFIIIIIGFAIYRKKYIEGAVIGILFAVFIILTWVMSTGEKIWALFPYLASRLSISSGYTEAMMSADFIGPGSPKAFILALLFLSSLTIVFIYLVFTKKIIWAALWLLPMITLFLAFKETFVRADGRFPLFLGHVFLSILYYFYLLHQMNIDTEKQQSTLSWGLSITNGITPILVLIALSTFSFGTTNITPSGEFVNILNLDQKNLIEENRQTMVKKYAMDPNFLEQIHSKKTIDIIPWDISLLFAYNLRWTPRPVIQSYASYTSTLDDLDANFFKKGYSPEQLIFSLNSIDQRYSIFDTPHTFRTLLDNYNIVTHTKDNTYMLLEKKQKTLSRDPVLIEKDNFNLNDNIPIPSIQNGHVFMNVDIEPTLLGKFLDIVYKPSVLYVEIKLNNDTKITSRLIRDTAKNGLFVSKYVTNLDDLQSVFSENYIQNITSLRFVGDTAIYNARIKVAFYEIPFNH